MDFSEHGRDPGKKLIGVIVVIIVHVIVFYALLHGLGRQIVSVIRQLPIETKIIAEIKPPPTLPDIPLPPPSKPIAPPPPFIPPPEVQVQQPQTPSVIQAITNVQPVQAEIHPQAPVVAEAAPAPAPGPAVVKAIVDFSTCDKPDYPRSSLRNEEQGTVRLKFLIDVDGHVASSDIERSSGHKALDAAAKGALSLCKFKPGMIDGKPQQTWTSVDYVWKLPN